MKRFGLFGSKSKETSAARFGDSGTVAPVHLTWDGKRGTEDEERISGARSYLEFLTDLHTLLRPNSYLEIGVRHGASLSIAKCKALGVDPAPEVTATLNKDTDVLEMTSDDFFDSRQAKKFAPFDLVFIDGMHLFEYVLRDFINSERICSRRSMIVLDDVLPGHKKQASRKRQTQVWTGDVWKLVEVLKRWRPELRVVTLDTHPTGLVVVTGLDPENTVLSEAYDLILKEFAEDADPPSSLIERKKVWPATLDAAAALAAPLSRATTGDKPGVRPKISAVVIAYDMGRELPRTLQTLSTSMQKGIDPSEYEIIVIDNGSSNLLVGEHLRKIIPGALFHRVENASKSPCKAINLGLSFATGDYAGTMIDGARMASPGLLSNALAASRTHPRAVVGTLAFHLGDEVQMTAIHHAYSQDKEDDMLARSGWEKDGYRLFDVSVFAGSSNKGWFHLPAETNALFAPGKIWDEIGGFDEAFASPGGGLVNLDVWKRLVEDPRNYPVMLLGEGTFHQIHGGIATNSVHHDPVVRQFQEEYKILRGEYFAPPSVEPHFFGSLNHLQGSRIWSGRADFWFGNNKTRGWLADRPELALDRDIKYDRIEGIGDLYVFILSWNRPLYLWACLDSLYRHTRYPARFIIADNGSDDPLVKEVIEGFRRRGMFHAVHLCENNQADRLQWLIDQHQHELGKYFGFVESDVYVFDSEKGWARTFIEAMEADPLVFLAGSIVDLEDFVDLQAMHELFPGVSHEQLDFHVRIRNAERNPYSRDEEIIDPHNPPGRLMMFRTSALDYVSIQTDGKLASSLTRLGLRTQLFTTVKHRHLSMLNVFDYQEFDVDHRHSFFDALNEAATKPGKMGDVEEFIESTDTAVRNAITSLISEGAHLTPEAIKSRAQEQR